MNSHPWLGVFVIAAITFIDFLISLAKAAFLNVNEPALQNAAAEGDKRAAEADSFRDSHEYSFLSSAWTVLCVSWIVDGVVFTFNLVDPLYLAFAGIMGEFSDTLAAVLSVILTLAVSIVVIYFVILFSHMLPDKIGRCRADKLMFKLFGLMKLVNAILTPFSFLLESGSRMFLKMVRIDPDEADRVTEEEIISIVNDGQEQGVIEADEAEMISNIITFDEKQAGDIMTHRTKMIAVSSDMGIEEAMNFCAAQSFSRFPLYTDDIDNIVGVIHLKDIVKCFSSNDYKDKTLIDIARKPLFVPDTQSIDDLFEQMQKNRVHMAIVIDEYGQTAGLVAMEDILEEIVGNIRDEFDKEEEEPIKKTGENEYICLGEVQLRDLADDTDMDVNDEDLETIDTLSGLIISILDRIPDDGETATVTYGGYELDILETKNKMIRRVKMVKLPEPEQEATNVDEPEE